MQNSILNYLNETATKFPDKVAFCDSDKKSITFLELEKETKIVGSFLINKFKNITNKPIVVLTERNIRSIPSFLGTVYSGNFYIPVDCTLPEERIALMLDIAKPLITINCSDKEFNIKSHNIINYKEIKNNQKDVYDNINVINTQPLYGIFTSGSTGFPKLVIKSHLSLISFIDEYTTVFNFTENDIQGNQIPFYFDASTKDLFTTLKVGCTTNIISKGLFSQPGKLAEYLENNKITSICWVPSALAMLSMFNVFSKYKFNNIKKVLFVGEAMHSKQLNIWIKALPWAKFINLYGSTENAGNCLSFTISKPIDDNERVPIGKAFKNVNVFLLDEDNKEITKENQEDIGEICVSGDTIALGYYNNLKANNEKFCQNPLNKNYYERIFRTGDVGKYDKDGNIIYLCRKDFQIKLNGYRIELGDIEVMATSCEGINSSCCIYDEHKKKIVLYYSAKTDIRENLIAHLKTKLPAYMLPSKYIYLEEMPLNQNGKTNRTKLKEMYLNNTIN